MTPICGKVKPSVTAGLVTSLTIGRNEDLGKVARMADIPQTIAKIVASAWADETFQKDLKDEKTAGDPAAIHAAVERFLQRQKMEVPIVNDFKGKLQLVANTDKIRFIVIPERPEFTDTDMALIVKLRQVCAMDCSCKFFGGVSGFEDKIAGIVHKIVSSD